MELDGLSLDGMIESLGKHYGYVYGNVFFTVEIFIQNKRSEKFVVQREFSTPSYFYTLGCREHFHGFTATLTQSTWYFFGRLNIKKVTKASEKSVNTTFTIFNDFNIIEMLFYSNALN